MSSISNHYFYQFDYKQSNNDEHYFVYFSVSIGGIASLFFGISIISTMQFLFGAMHYIVKTYTARKMEARKRKRPH